MHVQVNDGEQKKSLVPALQLLHVRRLVHLQTQTSDQLHKDPQIISANEMTLKDDFKTCPADRRASCLTMTSSQRPTSRHVQL